MSSAVRVGRGWIPAVVGAAVLAFGARGGEPLKVRGPYSMEKVRVQCLEFSGVKIGPSSQEHDAARCRVVSFAEFGRIGEKVYYRALYCLTPHWAADDEKWNCEYSGYGGIGIFEGRENSETVGLLLERAGSEVGLLAHGEPEIVQSRHGAVMHVNIALTGTGAINESEYYLLKSGSWHRLDADRWWKDVLPRIPADLAMRKGVWPDLEKMAALIPLYRRGDANCCPTGGALHVALSIERDAFVVKSVRQSR